MTDLSNALDAELGVTPAVDYSKLGAALNKEMSHTSSGAAETDEQILRRKLDPERGLGKPGLDEFYLRGQLSTSRSLAGKMKRWGDAYPDGELREVETGPGSKELVFRKNATDQWRKLDAGLFEALELGDIADLAGDVPAILGELGATVRTKGISLFQLLLRSAAGASIGDVVRGLSQGQYEDFGTTAESAAAEGVFGAAGVGAGEVIQRFANVGRGSGWLSVEPFIKKTQRQADKFDLPGFYPAQATDNPIVQAFARQSRAMSGKIRAYELKQEAAALKVMEFLGTRGETMGLGDDLIGGLAAQTKRLRSVLEKTRTSVQTGAKAIKDGITEYMSVSGRAVNQQYTHARSLEEPDFDLGPAADAADALDAGIAMRMQDKTKVDPETGEELTEEVYSNLQTLQQELRGVVDTIRNAQTDEAGDVMVSSTWDQPGGASAFDQIKALRTKLHDISLPPDGIFRNEHRLAREMYDVLTDVMNNPVGGSPEFREAWKKANEMAADRFMIKELDFIQAALKMHKGGKVEQLYKSLWQNNNATQLDFIKKYLPQKSWAQFKEATVSDFLDSPRKITERLKVFDPESLSVVFSPREVEEIARVGLGFDRLFATNISEVVAKQNTLKGTVEALVLDGNQIGIAELFKMAQRSPPGRDGVPVMIKKIRAGLIDIIYDAAKEETKTGVRLNPKAMLKMADTVRGLGGMRFLTNRDRLAVLRTLPRYLNRIQQFGTGAGESIRRAAIMQHITTAPFSALRMIAEEVGVGRVLVSGWGQRFLYGLGHKKYDFNTLKRISGALAIMAADYEEEGKVQ